VVSQTEGIETKCHPTQAFACGCGFDGCESAARTISASNWRAGSVSLYFENRVEGYILAVVAEFAPFDV